MGRPRTGSVFAHGTHFDIQLTLPNGTRSKRRCMVGMTEDEARREAARLNAIVQRNGAVLASDLTHGETVEDWGDRWWKAREARGIRVEAERPRWRKWVLAAPVRASTFGALAIKDVARADIEDLVAHLDRAVQREELAWKTAANAWGLVSKAFDDATNDKDRALRVRDDNPAIAVRPPDRGQKKRGVWIHPGELLQLLGNEDEDLELRRAIALNAYLYARPGELRATRWSDVDLEAGRVLFHDTILRDGTESSGTKTAEPRSVPIEATLLPLLAAMRKEAKGKGRVVALPPDTVLADVLRAALQRSGVDREELFKESKTRRRLKWYDLRATGITWRAIRGDQPLEIMRHAGHENFETTLGYVREAESLGRRFAVFPPLPECLFRAKSNRSEYRSANRSNGAKLLKRGWVDRDSNPGPTD